MDLKFENINVFNEYALSSDESYLITFSGINEKDPNKENVFVWDLFNDELIRGFVINKDEKFENFKWSPDAKFFGRIKNDVLIVYESPKMQIIAVIKIKKYNKINYFIFFIITLRMQLELDNQLKIILNISNGFQIKM